MRFPFTLGNCHKHTHNTHSTHSLHIIITNNNRISSSTLAWVKGIWKSENFPTIWRRKKWIHCKRNESVGERNVWWLPWVIQRNSFTKLKINLLYIMLGILSLFPLPNIKIIELFLSFFLLSSSVYCYNFFLIILSILADWDHDTMINGKQWNSSLVLSLYISSFSLHGSMASSCCNYYTYKSQLLTSVQERVWGWYWVTVYDSLFN